MRDGRQVAETPRIKIEQIESLYRLTIKEAWDVDAGEYTCEVTNPFGRDTSVAKLKVQAPPVIERHPQNQVHPEGEVVRMKVYFSGIGPFTLRYAVNGQQLRDGGN